MSLNSAALFGVIDIFMKSGLNNRVLRQRFVAVCGCKRQHETGGECLWIQLLDVSFYPTPEGGVEVRTQPSPAAVPPTQTVGVFAWLCGNKLTGRVNIKVWKEPLLFLRWSHQSHSPAWFKYSFKSGTQPVKFKHQPAQRRSYDVRGDVMMGEHSAALLPVCEGDVWWIVTSRGGDSGEDLIYSY